MTPFGTAMRQYIARGLSPASAMRSTWVDVRRGSVARPPRGKRRNPAAGSFRVGPKAARRLMAWHGGQGSALYEAGSLATAGRPIGRDTFAAAARELEREAREQTGRGQRVVSAQARRMRQALHDNPRVRTLKVGRQRYEVLGLDPRGSGRPGDYIARRRGTVYHVKAERGRVTYTHPIAPSTRGLQPAYREAFRRYRGNAPPSVSRIGQLAAEVYRRSGVHSHTHFQAIVDAHAQTYGVPRGDVYEYARRWLTPGGSLRRRPLGSAAQSSEDVRQGYVRDRWRRRSNPPRGWRKTAGGWRTPEGSRGTPLPRRGTCECSDPGCPVHRGQSQCPHAARTTVYRSDMEDRSGTRMCPGCAADALDSGVFYNPGGSRPVVIYDRVLKIFARKERGPHRGQRFVHNFRTSARMLGLPNGDLLITGR